MERLTEERIAELLELHDDDAACAQLVSARPLHDIYVQACQLAHELRALRSEHARLDEVYGEALERSERYQTEALELRAAVEALATKLRNDAEYEPVLHEYAYEAEATLRGVP